MKICLGLKLTLHQFVEEEKSRAWASAFSFSPSRESSCCDGHQESHPEWRKRERELWDDVMLINPCPKLFT